MFKNTGIIKRTYIIFRLMLVLAVIILCYLAYSASDGRDLLIIAIFLLALITIGLAFYKYIHLPMIRFHKICQLYLESYINEEELQQVFHISPVADSTLAMLIKKLNRTQILNLTEKQAQYIALQNQINPHFLYNTLESIRSEAICSDIVNVANMAEALGRFFRYSISNTDEIVSFQEEWANLQNYFKIQKYRFEEKLNLSYDFDFNEIRNYGLPKLTLQPILENSICHGLEEKINGGEVEISVVISEKRMLITIKDNGVGMPPSTVNLINRKMLGNLIDSASETISRSASNGIGLININNRIKLLFGEEYGLTIYSIENMGTDVEISLPLIKVNENEKRNFALQ